MQQILNSQDRNQAFLKFLLFFLITIILVVIAVYFNFRIPVKESNYYKTELERKRSQDSAQARFIAKLEEVGPMLGKLDSSGKLDNLLPQQIDKVIGQLDETKSNSNDLYSKSNKAIVDKFQVLKTKIVESRESKNDAERISKLKSLLDKCFEDLKGLPSQVLEARQSELNSIQGMEIVRLPPGQ